MEKILLIFGATGSLGAGVSEILITKDYSKIFLFGRNFNSDIVYPQHVKTINIGNLAEESNVIESFKHIPKKIGNSYFLYSTIGGFLSGPVIDMDYGEWKKMFDSNVNIAFLLSKHFSKLASKFSGCSICFTSAASVFETEKNKSAYGASKLALNYLVETLALEGKEYNMSANIVAPSIIDTPENRKWVKNIDQLTLPFTIAESVHKLFSEPEAYNGEVIKIYGNQSN